MPDEINEIELLQGQRGMAALTWVFYDELRLQGFDAVQAFRLTDTWLNASTSRPVSDEDGV